MTKEKTMKCTCGRKLVFSEELQKRADAGFKDACGCTIPDGWYCPVCHY